MAIDIPKEDNDFINLMYRSICQEVERELNSIGTCNLFDYVRIVIASLQLMVNDDLIDPWSAYQQCVEHRASIIDPTDIAMIKVIKKFYSDIRGWNGMWDEA